jgi:hypothetical protein
MLIICIYYTPRIDFGANTRNYELSMTNYEYKIHPNPPLSKEGTPPFGPPRDLSREAWRAKWEAQRAKWEALAKWGKGRWGGIFGVRLPPPLKVRGSYEYL